MRDISVTVIAHLVAPSKHDVPVQPRLRGKNENLLSDGLAIQSGHRGEQWLQRVVERRAAGIRENVADELPARRRPLINVFPARIAVVPLDLVDHVGALVADGRSHLDRGQARLFSRRFQILTVHVKRNLRCQAFNVKNVILAFHANKSMIP